MAVSHKLLFSPLRFSRSSWLVIVLRAFGLVVGLALLAALAFQHNVAMKAGYRAMPRVPAPELEVPSSILSAPNAIRLDQRSYTIYAIAAAPNDPTHMVRVAQKTVGLKDLADFKMETDMFALRLHWKPEPQSQFLGDKVGMTYRFPLGNGEWKELSPRTHGALFRSSIATMIEVSPGAEWADHTRWLGWGASQSGRIAPYQFFVGVAVTEPGTPMVKGGLKELSALNMGWNAWLDDKLEESDATAPFQGEIDAVREDLKFKREHSSAAQLASRHFGMPLMLALMAAGMIAASVSRLQWIGISFAMTSVAALVFLALLDLRAVHHSCAMLEDRTQPPEVRLQAAAKACGSFFWRDTVGRSMESVVADKSNPQVAAGTDELLRWVIRQ